MIVAQKLSKVYRKYKVEDGFWKLTKNLLKRRYENVTAVDEVSFEIPDGSCVGLLGANGAGKTTLVKMLTGLLVPTSGSASVMTYNPSERLDEYLRQIGIVMGQRQQLWIDVSTYENLRLNQVIYDLTEKQFKSRLNELASLLDVEKHLHTQIRKLSLGEKMKMELIASFLHRPRVLFLDEPTIGLDLVAQNRIRNFIKERIKEDKVTVLLTSHYIKDLEELCPRVLFIQNGKLLHDGALETLAGKMAEVKRISWNPGPKTTTSVKPPEALRSAYKLQTLDDGRYLMEVPSKEVASVVRTLINAGELEDLKIEPPSIEESLREVLAKNTGKTK